jgi:hypothetical protein
MTLRFIALRRRFASYGRWLGGGMALHFIVRALAGRRNGAAFHRTGVQLNARTVKCDEMR